MDNTEVVGSTDLLRPEKLKDCFGSAREGFAGIVIDDYHASGLHSWYD